MVKIYKIVCNVTGLIYIGKTSQKYLSQRLAMHRYHYKLNMLNGGHCCTSSEIIENGDYRMELIEETEDDTRERYWILNTDCVNLRIPGRRHPNWYQGNKGKYHQGYYQDNKQKTKDYQFNRYHYRKSWGGESIYSNNLIDINTNLFF